MVGCLGVAAKVEGYRTILVGVGLDTGQGVRPFGALDQTPSGIIDGYRPEPGDRHVHRQNQHLRRLAIIVKRADGDVVGVLDGLAQPTRGRPPQMPHRVDAVFSAKHAVAAGDKGRQTKHRLSYLAQSLHIPLGQ